MANEMYYLRNQSRSGRIDANVPLKLRVEAAGKVLDNHTLDTNNSAFDLASSILALMQMGWSPTKAFIILQSKSGQNAKIELARLP